MVGIVNVFVCSEIGGYRRGYHDRFTKQKWMSDKNGGEDDPEKREVQQTLKTDLFVFGEVFADRLWGARIITRINHVKHCQQNPNTRQPDRPGMAGHPPKRDS